MKRYVLSLVCLLGAFAIAQSTQPVANLVANGSFAEAKEKFPVGWTVSQPGHIVEVDVEDKPSGAAHALKVTVHKTAEGQAAVLQAVRNVPPNTKLVLAGQMKGSDKRLGYLQVKLKKAGQEIERKKTDWNTDDWKAAKVEFDTGEADEISVELRFSQSTKAMDQKIRFADITLTKAQP